MILSQDENLKFNWFVFEIAENFKELERYALEVQTYTKINDVPFKHYIRYKKITTLKLQYNLIGLLRFEPDQELANLAEEQKIAQKALDILNSFVVLDPSNKYAFEVLSGENLKN